MVEIAWLYQHGYMSLNYGDVQLNKLTFTNLHIWVETSERNNIPSLIIVPSKAVRWINSAIAQFIPLLFILRISSGIG